MNTTSGSAAGIAIVLLGLGSPVAVAEEEAGHHQLPHSHVAVFGGIGFERDSHGHEENGAALGLKYELQFHDKWSIGAAVERLNGSDTHRSWVAAIPVAYHATENWRLFLGPGVESGDDHDKYLARVGVAYAIPVSQRWAIVPEFIVDIIEGGATTYVLGAAVGFGF